MKKRVLSLILTLAIVLGVMPTLALAAPKEIAIGTAAELVAWDGNSNAYLTQDIDLTGVTWVSKNLGTGVTFDGKSHKIIGFTQTSGTDDGYGAKRYGFFEDISGIVKNLGIYGSITVSETTGTVRAGLLAAVMGNNYSNVLNCYGIGTVEAPNHGKPSSLRLGSLIGSFNLGTMQNCYGAGENLSIVGPTVYFGYYAINSYYDSTLYKGEATDFIGKATAEMQSQGFADLLNANRDFVGAEYGQGSNRGNEWGFTAGSYPAQQPFTPKVLIEITDEAGLIAIKDDLSGIYMLKNDIVLTAPWTPIGTWGKPFMGSFDGNGHVISGMEIDAVLGAQDPNVDAHKGAGLFGASTGIIKNVGVLGAVASDKYYDRIGGIVGINFGAISNCFAKVTLVSKIVDNNLYAAGGIAGQNEKDGVISNCYSVSTSEGKISNKYGCVGQSYGNIAGVYYDKTVYPFTDKWDKHRTTGKATAEMQSPIFVKLLNANRGDAMQWTLKDSAYPSFGTDPVAEIPALSGTVTIEGTPKLGETLTATPVAFITTEGLSYQWLLTKDGKTRTVGVASETYTPSISEVGGTVTVKAVSSIQSGEIVSAPSDKIADDAAGSAAARAEKAKKVHNAIAYSYLDSSEPWNILDMVAAGQKANLSGIDRFISESVAVFKNPKLQATEDEKYIMALSALGIDATAVPLGDERINGVAAMAAKDISGTNTMVFSLPAYDSGSYTIPQNAKLKRGQIVTELLERQSAEGDWSLSGTDVDADMTAMAIHALAPIYVAQAGAYPGVSPLLQQEVIKAVDLSVNRLSQMQVAEKSFGKDYRGAFLNQSSKKANANSTAMVICALSALGIDPDTDYRFIKNGKSALDGLMAFTTKNGDGFGFTNTTKNDMATEQGFRALLSWEGITAAAGNPYNIYKLGEVMPTPPPVAPDPNPDGKPEEPAKQISATIRIVGDTVHATAGEHGKYVNWFQTRKFSLKEGSTVYDLFMLAINSSDLEQVGAEKNYVKTITAPKSYGGYALSEFDNGQNSGWMYIVNNSYPDVGLQSQTLKNDDAVVWHYVDDYKAERDTGKWKEAKDEAPLPLPTAPAMPDRGSTIAPEVTANGSGEAAVRVSKKDADSALESIKKNNLKEMVIAPKIKGDAKKVTVTVPKTAVSGLAEGTKAALSVESAVAKISFSTGALATIAKGNGEEASITAERATADKMSAENKALVGEHPVYNFSVMVGKTAVSEFGGAVTISLPYTPKKGENTEKITVYYIDKAGKATKMQGARFNSATGSVVFETNHFSAFAIAYDNGKIGFTDVKPSDWFYDAVNFVWEQKLFGGTSEKTFEPLATMNRAMLWTVLYRMEGSPNSTGSANSYSDAQKWVISQKLSDGTNPNGGTTREQIAVMLYRYGEMKKYDVSKGASLAVFIDASSLSGWAKPAMEWATAANIIGGKTPTTLAPSSVATRAEVATMLQRFMMQVAK